MEPINIKVRQDEVSFVLKQTNTYSGNVIFTGLPSIAGNVSLVGPTGPAGPQLKGFSVFCSGLPNPSEIIGGGIAPYNFTIDVTKCVAKAVVPSTADFTFTILKNNIEIGNILFQAGLNTGVVTVTSLLVTSNDYVTFKAQSNMDLSLSDIGITIRE